MTPSPLLTSTPSADTLSDADCPKRNVVPPPSFGVITSHPAGTRSGPSPPSSTSTTPTPTPTPTCESAINDAYDASVDKIQTMPTDRTWTGTPIRAIIPLPRRKLGANGVQDNNNNTMTFPSPSPSSVRGRSLLESTLDMIGSPPPSPTRPYFPFEAEDEEEEEQEEEEEEEEERIDEDCDMRAVSQCCSYQSITAAHGLSGWSFEELRVECYAQSRVARGTRPPPAVQPALAIPPAFVPRFVPRN